ncbi:MAG TPA: AAA family ATPase, partial [Chloroflexota bacterium]|nr:AAA family ATPase [Chloroflexota bacterium]
MSIPAERAARAGADALPTPLEPEEFQRVAEAVQREVASAIVGQEEAIQGVLITLIAGGHALLEGVPGLGKTLLVRTLSQVLDLKFNRIQFTPDLMPSDITGTMILDEQDGRREFRYVKGPIFAN